MTLVALLRAEIWMVDLSPLASRLG
jgi:hypothetical protein